MGGAVGVGVGGAVGVGMGGFGMGMILGGGFVCLGCCLCMWGVGEGGILGGGVCMSMGMSMGGGVCMSMGSFVVSMSGVWHGGLLCVGDGLRGRFP